MLGLPIKEIISYIIGIVFGIWALTLNVISTIAWLAIILSIIGLVIRIIGLVISKNPAVMAAQMTSSSTGVKVAKAVGGFSLVGILKLIARIVFIIDIILIIVVLFNSEIGLGLLTSASNLIGFDISGMVQDLSGSLNVEEIIGLFNLGLENSENLNLPIQ